MARIFFRPNHKSFKDKDLGRKNAWETHASTQ